MAKINRLKVVLVEKEKSGKWLADQLGKSTCTVSKWCSNTTQPDLQTLSCRRGLARVDTRTIQGEAESSFGRTTVQERFGSYKYL